MTKKSWIIIGVVVVLALWAWGSYNGFVSANQAVDNQWAQVEVQYQRRFDLIPNLVNAVKGIFNQEKAIFNGLAEARANYAGAKTVEQKVTAANQVESALGRLLAIVENYPQLTSSQAVLQLMAQLEGTENRVAVERSRYNDSVTALNIRVQRFPSNLLAKLFGFHARDLFKAAEGAAESPKVNF